MQFRSVYFDVATSPCENAKFTDLTIYELRKAITPETIFTNITKSDKNTAYACFSIEFPFCI